MADTKHYYVYILASKYNGTLYTGFTEDLLKRVYQHRNGLVDGFTKKYAVHRLVYYEIHGTPEGAITREKQIKKWNRAWKKNLIEKDNPDWEDLYDALLGRPVAANGEWIPACAGMTSGGGGDDFRGSRNG